MLSKIPFKERDVIGRLLLRNGKQLSVLLYGGLGNKHKSSPAQLGYMLSLEINRSARREMYSSREYTLSWQHRRCSGHQAFYLLCFYLELISRMAPEDELHEGEGAGEHRGLFRVLSNALYQLDGRGVPEKNRHLGVFLCKLIIELGITPNLKHCLYSQRALGEVADFQLLLDQGGFVDRQYLDRSGPGHRKVWAMLSDCWRLPYPEAMARWPGGGPHCIEILFHYLLFQTQLEAQKIRTASLVI